MDSKELRESILSWELVNCFLRIISLSDEELLFISTLFFGLLGGDSIMLGNSLYEGSEVNIDSSPFFFFLLVKIIVEKKKFFLFFFFFFFFFCIPIIFFFFFLICLIYSYISQFVIFERKKKRVSPIISIIWVFINLGDLDD